MSPSEFRKKRLTSQEKRLRDNNEYLFRHGFITKRRYDEKERMYDTKFKS